MKRESEKRHRDREKGTYTPSQMEDSYENDLEQVNTNQYRDFADPSHHYTVSERDHMVDKQNAVNISNADILYRNHNLAENLAGSLKINTGFQSEAARHIISEMDDRGHNQMLPNDADQYRRSTPKKKKRHFTAPNTINSDAMQSYLQNGGQKHKVSKMIGI